MMTNVTSISIPDSLVKRARELEINISQTARRAVEVEVQKEEQREAAKCQP